MDQAALQNFIDEIDWLFHPEPDGSIAAWGYNEYDQCDVPLPNTNFTAIARFT